MTATRHLGLGKVGQMQMQMYQHLPDIPSKLQIQHQTKNIPPEYFSKKKQKYSGGIFLLSLQENIPQG
jgi:hypothetical protein